jgi:hypothetical protein
VTRLQFREKKRNLCTRSAKPLGILRVPHEIFSRLAVGGGV